MSLKQYGDNQIVMMNFSGVYREQTFWKKEDMSFLDFQFLSGTNCYCDEEAADAIREKITCFSASGLHFLDSGNYHYLSLMWLEKMQEPFALVVFDNHTDMQPPAFGGLLSCGGWIAEAVNTLPLLKKVLLIGPDEAAYSQVNSELKERVEFLSREELERLDQKKKSNRLCSQINDVPENLPLYLSVDKDVLAPGEAKTTWSQGDMTLSELISLLEVLDRTNRIIAMDVCGEWENPGDPESFCNEKANQTLLEFWKNRRKTDEK